MEGLAAREKMALERGILGQGKAKILVEFLNNFGRPVKFAAPTAADLTGPINFFTYNVFLGALPEKRPLCQNRGHQNWPFPLPLNPPNFWRTRGWPKLEG